ncbi:hypothetical protein Tco_1400208 [Tanacetum coccineum]
MDAAEFEAPPSPNYVPGPEHPPSPDYMPGPEHPPFPDYMLSLEEPKQAPLSPDYVLEPEYPEYLVPSDVKAPIEDYPLPDVASPAALSPGYVTESDPEEDPEEDPDDGGYDDDDESSNDDDDDNEEQDASEDDNEEEEEHPDVADSSAVPVDDPVPSVEVTEAFETDESAPTHVPSPRRRTTRIFVRPQTPMSAAIEALMSWFEVKESSAAAVTRQAGHALTGSVDYGFIDTVDASIRATESRAMTAMGVVNEKVTDLATTQRQETHELQREAVIARQAWAYSESRSQAMEVQIRALQRDVNLVRTLEAGPQDGPADVGSSC